VDRTPRDPPLPRRGNRKRGDEADEDSTEGGAQTKDNFGSPETTRENGEWQGVVAAIAAEKPNQIISSTADGLDDTYEETGAGKGPKKLKKRRSRNVGGWVSPKFGSLIERTWLDGDKYDSNLDFSRFVPQAGDIVL